MTAGETSATVSNGDARPTSPSPRPISVLFVCLGNICRSTMSEGVFQSITHPAGKRAHPLISRIDSCGTGAYHVGDSPDPRTMATLKQNGITTYTHAARKFRTRDFEEFDYILAMDDDNLEHLQRLRTREVKKSETEDSVGKVMLFGDFGSLGRGRRKGDGRGEEVMDPYYGGDDGFEIAYEQAVRFSKKFLEELEAGRLS